MSKNKEEQARALLQVWLDKQGHDRCWYYPEIFLELCKLFDVKASLPPSLPTLEEFQEGCKKYQIEQFSRRTQ